jgi:CRISPR/Cas system CMR subunit Cmr6 (Cas7 group RAMP superfamily)
MISPEVNMTSYLRYKLFNAYEQRGEAAKDNLSRLSRELMEIERAFRCEALVPLFRAIETHVDRVVKALEENGYTVAYDGRLGLMTRLAMHSPYTSPLELIIPWHHFWNVPYIPASMLKQSIELAIKSFINRCSIRDFGTLEEEEAPIAILDAYPVQCPHDRNLFTVDYVLLDNFGGWDEVPILTISRGTAFRIVLMRKDKADLENRCTEDELLRILRIALHKGIGALRELGYGIFDVDVL